MFTCPNCGATLARVAGPHGVSWACPRCGGRAVGLGLLRRTPVRDYVGRVWVVARLKDKSGGRPCPVCESPMVAVPSLPDYASPTLDVCRRCQIFWFDPREFEQVPAVSMVQAPVPRLSAADAVSASATLSPEAVEAVAVQRAAAEAERIRGGPAAAGPDAWWQWIPGLLGMPVEIERGVAGVPWATWGLSAVIAAFSIVAFFNLSQAVETLALIPGQAGRYYGLTLLTSFFLHGGIFHLASNLYFLLVFGDNVEDYLGHARFLLMILAATLVGDLAHIALDPRSQIPVIGASGGISGPVTFYGLRFPRAKLAFILFFRWVRIPAWGFLALWIALQILTAWQQVEGLTAVSALAHLGGAAVGVWFWLTWGLGTRKPV